MWRVYIYYVEVDICKVEVLWYVCMRIFKKFNTHSEITGAYRKTSAYGKTK